MSPVLWMETDEDDPRCICGGELVKHTSAGRGRYKDLPELRICSRCWTAWNPGLTPACGKVNSAAKGRIRFTRVVSRRSR